MLERSAGALAARSGPTGRPLLYGIVDGGPECGCRYGLAGPEYGKYRVVPQTCWSSPVRHAQPIPGGAEIVGSWHQPHCVVQMFAGGETSGGTGRGGTGRGVDSGRCGA